MLLLKGVLALALTLTIGLGFAYLGTNRSAVAVESAKPRKSQPALLANDSVDRREFDPTNVSPNMHSNPAPSAPKAKSGCDKPCCAK